MLQSVWRGGVPSTLVKRAEKSEKVGKSCALQEIVHTVI